MVIEQSRCKKAQLLFNSLEMKCPEEVNPSRQDSDCWFCSLDKRQNREKLHCADKQWSKFIHSKNATLRFLCIPASPTLILSINSVRNRTGTFERQLFFFFTIYLYFILSFLHVFTCVDIRATSLATSHPSRQKLFCHLVSNFVEENQ
jgi:hypothetical protein